MTSAIKAKAIGSMPPTPKPMTKHMNTFQPKLGMEPQIEVATKTTAAKRIDARRPMASAKAPHTSEPTTVPTIAARGR